jgi:hypothetical protein
MDLQVPLEEQNILCDRMNFKKDPVQWCLKINNCGINSITKVKSVRLEHVQRLSRTSK